MIDVPQDWSSVQDFPPAVGQKIVAPWQWIYQGYNAFLMRRNARCQWLWPEPNFAYGTDNAGQTSPNRITALTNTSLEDSSANWMITPEGSSTPAFIWNNFPVSSDGTRLFPQTCCVVIGADLQKSQPWLIKAVRIGDGDATHLFFDNLGLTDDELAYLVGKSYYIMKLWGDASHERVIVAPPHEAWIGSYRTYHYPEVQMVAILGEADGGTFTLALPGFGTTGALAHDATAQDVADAIAAVAPAVAATASAVSADDEWYPFPLGTGASSGTNGSIVVVRYVQEVPNPSVFWMVYFPTGVGHLGTMTSSSALSGSGWPTTTAAPSVSVTLMRDGGFAKIIDGISDPTDPMFPSWRVGQWTGKTFACNSSFLGGYTRFGTVVDSVAFYGSTPAGLDLPEMFTNPAASSGSNWFMVQMDSPFIPSDTGPYALFTTRPPWYRFEWDGRGQNGGGGMNFQRLAWHGMSGTGYWTKGIDLEPAVYFNVPLPSASVTPADGPTVSVDVFDIDFRSSDNDTAMTPGGPGQHVHPHFYRSFRGMQVAVEVEALSWVHNENYASQKWINPFSAASLFYYAGVNGYLDTLSIFIDPVSGAAKPKVSPINHGCPDGCAVYYDVRERITDKSVASGVFWCADGETLLPFDASAKYPNCSTFYRLQDAKVYISFGWTRKAPRMVRYILDRMRFSPTDEDSSEPSAALPGQWGIRAKSSAFMRYNDQWGVGAGMSIDSVEAFNTSDLVRYMADNFSDASTGIGFATGDSSAPIEYIVKGNFEAVFPSDPGYTGTVTAAATGWFSDSTKAWNYFGEWGGFSAAATGGSASAIQCSSVTPAFDGGGALISGDLRWDTGTGRWANFVVEILDGPCAGAKSVITGPTSGGAFTEITFTAISGFSPSYTVTKIIAANVGIGDTFTVTVSGSVVGAVSFTATTTSPSDVATGLAAAWNVAGIKASVEGDYLVLMHATTVTASYALSTSDGDGSNTQTLSSSTEDRWINFKIHEPKFINGIWNGIKIRFNGDPTKEVVALANDDTTCFFTGAYAPAAGDTYEIRQIRAGSIVKWDGSEWDTLKDSRTDPGNFNVAPTFVTRFGRIMNGDYWQEFVYSEWRRCVEQLSAFVVNPEWFGKPGEINSITADTDNAGGGDVNYDDAGEGWGIGESVWENVLSVGISHWNDGGSGIISGTQTFCGTLTDPRCTQSWSVDYEIDTGGTPPFSIGSASISSAPGVGWNGAVSAQSLSKYAKINICSTVDGNVDFYVYIVNPWETIAPVYAIDFSGFDMSVTVVSCPAIYDDVPDIHEPHHGAPGTFSATHDVDLVWSSGDSIEIYDTVQDPTSNQNGLYDTWSKAQFVPSGVAGAGWNRYTLFSSKSFAAPLASSTDIVSDRFGDPSAAPTVPSLDLTKAFPPIAPGEDWPNIDSITGNTGWRAVDLKAVVRLTFPAFR